MKYRTYNFLANRTGLGADVLVHDINMQDVISNIILTLGVVNGSNVVTEHPLKCITKIELVDGSDVLYSLNGFQADALDWYDRGGKFRNNWNAYWGGNTMNRTFAINFGRYLWDPEYAFDPTQFDNPQLRITYNYALGGAAPASMQLAGFANLFDEKPVSLKGFLMSKEIKSYTAVAGHNYTDMPRKYPYRAIYIQPFLRGSAAYSTITNIKLSEDEDKKIPVDLSPYQIMDTMSALYPKVREDYYIEALLAGDNVYCAPSDTTSAQISSWRPTIMDRHITVYDGDGGEFVVRSQGGAINALLSVQGRAPHSVFEIAVGPKDNPEDAYDVRQLGSLKLDTTNAASGAIVHIFLQQYRNY